MMDKATFLLELFDHYDVDTRPIQTVMDRSVRRAQSDIGMKVEDISDDGIERSWLENRVERYAIDSILATKSEDFDYNKASLSQVFENLSRIRDNLDRDWKVMSLAAMRRKSHGAAFSVISPGFAYDSAGRPVRR